MLEFPLVLDTHVWLWLVNGDPIAPQARTSILEAASHGQVRVPAISAWEVGMLAAKGRIQLAMPCLDWVRAALDAPGVALAELTPAIAIESCRVASTAIRLTA